ncbi:unnamed protein product [Peronospora farinosa]|uniref:BZIP domain-containing protein n=1 Tax=Peronospora farinosa TaxID=134698 RepID=A0ABN8CCJ6_9STRA|nr:unnamed protein product [Peronospora farinosa]
MLMEHHHTQGRSSWTSSLYSNATDTSSIALPFDGLHLFAYSNNDDKPLSESAIVIHVKRVTDEKRRAKHREAQRRFVNRKKIKMTQLKQLVVELEKRHLLLQAVSEQEMLVRDNCALIMQINLQKKNNHVDEDKIKEEHGSGWKVQTFEW